MSSPATPETEAWFRLFAGRVDWKKVSEFISDLRPHVAENPVLWAELKDLMERAAREGLPYDKGSDGKGFKWPMERACQNDHVDLGHLKMDEGDDQHRIYFSAPKDHPVVLLALVYGPKHKPDPDWKEKQNDHIDEAAKRHLSWEVDNSGSAKLKQ
jgi:hypothetical protein